jgi:PhnB protein
MPRRNLFDQLDQAVQALLNQPRAAGLPEVDPLLAGLVQVAAELRDLPRAEFKERLKSQFEGRDSMSAIAEPMTAAIQSATPYLTVRNAAEAIDFYKRVFGAKEIMRLAEPSGRIGHAQISIGNTPIMLSDEYPDYGAISPQTMGGSPVRMNLQVSDVDGLARLLLAEGAKEVRPVQDQFYGERSGQFTDPYGYSWTISQKIEDISTSEMQRRFDEMMGVPQQPSSPTPDQPKKVDFIRKGFRTLTPYIAVRDVHQVIDFVQGVFGAEGQVMGTGSEGGLHGEYKIGDSMLMIGGGGSWQGEQKPASLYLNVPDADATYAKALSLGATSLYAPMDMPYGAHEGGVKDAAGNIWYIATRKGQPLAGTARRPEERFQTITPYLHLKAADKMIDFLQRAFGGQEVFRVAEGGAIHHATVKIGSSVLHLGESHGEAQPLPSMFYLYVEDVDAMYRRALEAGAKSEMPPADQPYGDRNGAVYDPFGNLWYIGTHVKDMG